MFHAVGLKVIEARQQYKEGFERSMYPSRADMSSKRSMSRRRREKGRDADVAAGDFNFSCVSSLRKTGGGRRGTAPGFPRPTMAM